METIKENKKLLIGLIIALVILIIGVSYAVYNYTFTGSNNSISTTGISIKFLEGNNTISLTNALPQSDESGKLNDSFDFEVTTKTKKDTYLSYNILIDELTVDSGYSSLDTEDVKVYLTDYENNPLIRPVLIGNLRNYILYSDINEHSSSNETIKDKYKLRVWIDDSVDASSWTNSTKLQYKFRLKVSSTDSTVADSCFGTSVNGEGTVAITSYNCQDKAVIIPKSISITPEYGFFEVVENPSQSAINSCASLFQGDVLTDEEAIAFCSGTGFFDGTTLSEYISYINDTIANGKPKKKASALEEGNMFAQTGIVNYVAPTATSYTVTEIESLTVRLTANTLEDSDYFQDDLLKRNTDNFNYKNAYVYNNLITSVIIPDTVTTIDEFAFEGNSITKIIIPDSVTEIGYRAFEEGLLSTVILGKGLTTIGARAFSGNELKYVYIPSDSALTETTGIGGNAFGTYGNNHTLTIYNNSGKKFKWYYITQVRNDSTDNEYNFVTGSVPTYDNYGAAIITTGEIN